MSTLLHREGRDANVELSVLFCDDPVIHALNRDYRGIDRPTDVLSFGQEGATSTEDEDASGWLVPAFHTQYPTPLGDVVISLETARRQAESQRQAIRREVEWLLLHGVLHLLGYDDETDDGLQEMIARQQAVLTQAKAPLGQPRQSRCS